MDKDLGKDDIFKYLTETIVGQNTGRTYGKKGDKVKVLDDSRDQILVELSERFFVREHQLSIDPVTPDKEIPVTLPAVQPIKKKRATRKKY